MDGQKLGKRLDIAKEEKQVKIDVSVSGHKYYDLEEQLGRGSRCWRLLLQKY